MRNAGLEEAQAGIKIAGKNINNLRYADDTTLMAETTHSSVLAWRIPGTGSLVGCRLWGRTEWDTTEGTYQQQQQQQHNYCRRHWRTTPVLSAGNSHGRRSLVGCSPWGHEKSDMTERLHFHFSLSCIGGGNGNPLQCSCLENLRDGGAWWVAVYGVSQSRTRLKQLSSSSSRYRK